MTELTLEVFLKSKYDIEYYALEALIRERQRGRKDLDGIIDMVTFKVRAIESQLYDIKNNEVK